MDNIDFNSFNGKTIFITGGTGFIGGRLIEKIMDNCNVRIKVLVSSYLNLPRVARYQIEIIKGNILDSEVLKNGIKDCDIVIHCAFGNKGSSEERRKVTVEGTKNILEACVSSGVNRFIHLSTFRVYEILNEGVVDESSRPTSVRTVYSDSKIEAEKLVFEYYEKYNLPVSVIQPATVYGPYAPGWTMNVIEQLKTSKIILVNDGSGYCNAVYIDDVADSILLAAINENSIGEKFLIAYENPVTWKEFYSAYEEILGVRSTVSMTVEEAKQLFRKKRKKQKKRSVLTVLPGLMTDKENIKQLKSSRELSFGVKLLNKVGLYSVLKNKFYNDRHELHRKEISGKDPADDSKEIIALDPNNIDYLSKRSTVDISKAKKLLGYNPKYNFKKGMELTKQWIIWRYMIEEVNKVDGKEEI